MPTMKTCDECGEQKPDVKTRIDPYRSGLWDEDVEMDLCDDCTFDRVQSI